MIGWIKGKIVDRPDVGKLVIDTQGIGYDIETSTTTFFELEAESDIISLHIHTIVREDAFLLYGFRDKQERFLFRALIKVNGIGPKLAMSILSSISALEFCECINNQSIDYLVRLPGIGKKTAQRMLVEMKDAIKTFGFESQQNNQENSNSQLEAMRALEALGYKNQEATKMIKAIDTGGLTCEALIREALKQVH